MSEKFEAPHILTKPINPITDDISIGRMIILAGLASITTLETILLAYSVLKVKFLLIFLAGFLIILNFWIGWVFARSEKEYNFHLVKLYSKIRRLRGIECIRKFSDKASQHVIRSVTGWYGINEKTGLSRNMVNNEINWAMDKEFDGNWSCHFLTFPPAEGDKKTYNQRLKDAAQALPLGCGEKDIVISGQDMSFIVDDIEETLKDEKLSPIRRDELESIRKEFIDNAEHVDLIFLIHIMLPNTQFEEVAVANMQEVLNGYIPLLNNIGIKTIQIKDEADIVLILSGMLTGELYFVGEGQ